MPPPSAEAPTPWLRALSDDGLPYEPEPSGPLARGLRASGRGRNIQSTLTLAPPTATTTSDEQ